MKAAFDAIAAGTTWGAWLVTSPFAPVIGALEDAATNFLINRGLIVLNVGAVMVEGVVNQDLLDTAIDNALDKLKLGRNSVTPAQGAQIDADTTAAFDNFANVNATDASTGSVPDVSSSPL